MQQRKRSRNRAQGGARPRSCHHREISAPPARHAARVKDLVATHRSGTVSCMATAVSHLLVDGSNVMHAWPHLNGLAQRDRHAARARLVETLTVLQDGSDGRITVVFDGRGPELVVERPTGHVSFSVLTTPVGTTADDVIERLVARGSDPSTCVVATADRGFRETVMAAGGQVITPEELAARVTRAESEIRRRIRRQGG